MSKNSINNKNGNSKKDENQLEKYKKALILGAICIIAITAFLLTNSGEKPILKSEYKIGEVGYLDDIELSLKDVNYINNKSGIEISFEITNKRNNTITIIPDEYFMFYDINMVQIPNKYKNNKNIIKKDEKVSYKLQYDVTQKELYEIYFYSHIVENNVKFSFTSSDIKDNKIMQ